MALRIDPTARERKFAADPTVDVARHVRIEDEVARRRYPLRRRQGREMVGPCPICRDGDDRFSVNPKTQLWHCRRCDAGGDVIKLVELADRLDFRGAVAQLAGNPPPKAPRHGNGKSKPNGSANAYNKRRDYPGEPVIVATYDFRDENGVLLYQDQRAEFKAADGSFILKEGKHAKEFFVRRPYPERPGQWLSGLGITRRVLYRLPEIIKAVAEGFTIFIVESAGKADALVAWGLEATSNVGATNGWQDDFAKFLAGADIIILPDNDKSGRDYLDKVVASLVKVDARVRVLDLPGLPHKGDIKNWIAAGGTRAQFLALVETARPLEPPAADPEQADETAEAEAGAADDDDILRLISHGVGVEEDAAKALARVVWHRGHAGCTSNDIQAELAHFPDGLAKSFPNLQLAVDFAYTQALDREQRPKLEALNAEWCVVIDGARTRALRFENSEINGQVRMLAEFLAAGDFTLFYANRTVWLGGKRYEAMGRWWLKHPGRRQYRGLVFCPGNPAEVIDGKLNLWRGWGVEPKKGDWSLMQEHVKQVLCGNTIPYFEYVLDWMAWAAQNPDRQAEVALVFIGKKGTGKGALLNALRRIFGQHGLHISSPTHLTGRFNLHLRDCCLLFVDEAFWCGDRNAAGMLQQLITEADFAVEPKGRDVVAGPNRLHIAIAGEPDGLVIPAGPGERRYVTFLVSDAKQGALAYFRAINAQMENGGLEAMLFDLLHRDIGKFHPREIVRTAALLDQQMRNLSALEAWWVELLQSGSLPGALSDKPDTAPTGDYDVIVADGGPFGRVVTRPGLLSNARQSSPKLKNETEHALGRFLREQGCIRVDKLPGSRRRGWKFPPLEEARAAWIKKYPGATFDSGEPDNTNPGFDSGEPDNTNPGNEKANAAKATWSSGDQLATAQSEEQSAQVVR